MVGVEIEEGESLQLRFAFGAEVVTGETKGAILVDALFVLLTAAGDVDPELFPGIGEGIVVIEALTAAASCPRPGFEDDAVVEDAGDGAVADFRAGFCGDGPIAYPEVEGAVSGVAAGVEKVFVLDDEGLETRIGTDGIEGLVVELRGKRGAVGHGQFKLLESSVGIAHDRVCISAAIAEQSGGHAILFGEIEVAERGGLVVRL